MIQVLVEPAEWKRRVCHGGCIIHDDPADCDGPLQGHHVISQQHLRRDGHADVVWDVRIGVGICEAAHTDHTRGTRRIPRDRLPSPVVAFVHDLGLDWRLERYYP